MAHMHLRLKMAKIELIITLSTSLHTHFSYCISYIYEWHYHLLNSPNKNLELFLSTLFFYVSYLILHWLILTLLLKSQLTTNLSSPFCQTVLRTCLVFNTYLSFLPKIAITSSTQCLPCCEMRSISGSEIIVVDHQQHNLEIRMNRTEWNRIENITEKCTSYQ